MHDQHGHVTSALQKDWQWQLKNAITSFEELETRFPHLIGNSRRQNTSLSTLPFQVTPYYASLLGNDEACPIYAQLIPGPLEDMPDNAAMRDPLGEEEREVSPFLIHRYPDRVLFLATDRCASYCRYCMRKRLVGQGPSPKKSDSDEAFSYIRERSAIKEIIFSGGDPLILSDDRLDYLFSQAFNIPHIEMVRIHSRMLTFAPMRINDSLVEVLKKYQPLYLVTHFNHAKEITSQTIEAFRKLRQSGVVLLNQSVLLKGINDDEQTLEILLRSLIRHGVKPYYLHQCDVIHGAKHFRVPIKRSLEIMDNLRGRISGLLMPTLMIDIPGGHGKVAMSNSAVVKEDDDFIYLKGFKGGVAGYPKD